MLEPFMMKNRKNSLFTHSKRTLLTTALLFAEGFTMWPDQAGYPVLRENLTYYSGDIRISGTFVFPQTREKFPVFIMIHGSGEATRNTGYATKFAKKGIGVLTYDKRGCGQSGGKYEWNLNVSNKNLSLLAADALAGVTVISQDERVDKDRIGLWGISQAGWIAPMLAATSDLVSFMVLLSAPTIPVAQEIKFSMKSEKDPGYLASHTEEKIIRDMQSFQFADIYFRIVGYRNDPMKNIRKLKIPALWIYGGSDSSIPSRHCRKLIDDLQEPLFSTAWFDEYGHSLSEGYDPVTQQNPVDILILDWIGSIFP